MLILTKAKNGELEMEEADKLAKQALVRKEETNQQLENAKSESENFDESVAKLESSVQEIKNSLKKWENELRTLKARHKVAKATKNLNKEMAEIDSSSTVSMLERMKSKIEQEEALADAYGDMAKENKTLEQKLDELTNTTEQSADDDLAALKKEMGLND
jgi:phage shock protein A